MNDGNREMNMPSLIDFVLRNDLSGLKEGLARGSDPNRPDEDGRTPLIHAAIDNRIEAARILLESGANVNAQDHTGYSALHYSAQEYHPEIAALLLDNRAFVDIQDNYGNTPLWRAVFNSRGRGELAIILIRAGANKNHRNKNRKSPLDLAKNIANYDVAQFLN